MVDRDRQIRSRRHVSRAGEYASARPVFDPSERKPPTTTISPRRGAAETSVRGSGRGAPDDQAAVAVAVASRAANLVTSRPRSVRRLRNESCSSARTDIWWARDHAATFGRW